MRCGFQRSVGMPPSMFQVVYDPAVNILRISVAGFWQLEDVPRLAAEVDAQARAAQAVAPDFDVLVVSLGFPVQANDVADQLSQIMVRGIVLTSGRAAVVVGSQLNKLQAERTLAHPRLAVFSTIEDGLAWLGKTEETRLSA